jgi:hypothetical protein
MTCKVNTFFPAKSSDAKLSWFAINRPLESMTSVCHVREVVQRFRSIVRSSKKLRVFPIGESSLSIDLHHVIRFPGLVEELDPGAIEAQRHQEISPVDGLDPVRFRHVGEFL